MQKPTTTIFTRLLFYFIVVMIIPLLILIISYFYYSENNIARIVENQTETAIDNDIRNLHDLFDSTGILHMFLQRIRRLSRPLKAIHSHKRQ